MDIYTAIAKPVKPRLHPRPAAGPVNATLDEAFPGWDAEDWDEEVCSTAVPAAAWPAWTDLPLEDVAGRLARSDRVG